MTKLVYDDSKDLYEGLIIEIDNGNQNQVAQVFPNFRQKYSKLFAAAPDMADLLERLVNNGWDANISEEAKKILNTIP